MDDTVKLDVSDGNAIKKWYEEYDNLIRKRFNPDDLKIGYLCLIAETLALTAVQNALILKKLSVDAELADEQG